jgi:hypothetical protein
MVEECTNGGIDSHLTIALSRAARVSAAEMNMVVFHKLRNRRLAGGNGTKL